MASAIFFGMPAYGHTNPTLPIAFPYEVLHDGPLLYISLGTLFYRQTEFYRCYFRAERLPGRHICRTAGFEGAAWPDS